MLLVSALLAGAVPATAQRPVLPEHAMTIENGGYARNFMIARDEVYVAGRIERLPIPQPTAQALCDHAVALAAAHDEPAALVLYETGVERSDVTRRILTRYVVARLDNSADPAWLAAEVGAVSFELPEYAHGYAIFHAADALGDSLDLTQHLRNRPGVLSAEPDLRRRRFKRYTPNDPLFADQWHLRNTGQGGGTAGIDIRVTNVWAQGIFGSNVIIGIVDDGVEYTHPDLSPNYEPDYSRNWNGAPGDLFDPAPDTSRDDHGTPCAGLTSARGNNGIGVSGVAPLSGFSGLRLISLEVGDSEEAQAMAYSNQQIHVKNNSWGPLDTGDNLEAPGPLTLAALSNSVVTGRGGRGTIHVWAGGNGLMANDNANYDGYANSIYTIAVAAINDLGQQAGFSEPGACLVVTAPSDSGYAGIVTTDLLGEHGYNYSGAPSELADLAYTRWFSGTSASAPIVSGIAALMLNANPDLGWRDVQEILIRTARMINPSDTDWRVNDGSFTFNHKFGAGLVDANAAVNTALSWENLGPWKTVASNQPSLNLPIPDNDVNGVTTTFDITEAMRVEHITLTVTITHARRGQLHVALISPSGMESVLAEERSDTSANYSSWTFSSVRHWGENAQGVWTLRVSDRVAGFSGTLNSARLNLHGADFPAISHVPPVLFPIHDRMVQAGIPVSFDVIARDPVDLNVVTLSATNIPFWASFEPKTGLGGVTNTFTALFPFTGEYYVYFQAEDPDGVTEEKVTITVTPPPDVLLSTSFDSGLPAGWSIQNNGHHTATWRFDDPQSRGNQTGGTGGFAIADSDDAGIVNMDTELRTPIINCAGYEIVTLSFRTYYMIYSGDEIADVDISLNGSVGPWQNVWRRQFDFGGALVELDLSPIVTGQPNVMIRFRYHNANWDWFWQVDDVFVHGSSLIQHDSDGDGIPDEWEIEHFGNLTTANATSDYANNDFLDLYEFLAGTDPKDPNSLLRLEEQSALPGGGFRIRWQSAPDRFYRIGRSTNLPHFNTIESGIPSTPSLNTYEDSTATNSAIYFYRIELDL